MSAELPPRPRITREVLAVCLVAPPLVELLLCDERLPLRQFAINIAGSYINFIVFPVLCFSAFRVVYGFVSRPLGVVPWTILFTAVGMAVTGVASVGFREVRQALGDMPPGALDYAITSTIIAGFTCFAIVLFQRLSWERRRAEDHLREERQARLEAQLQALQARTSPHFLFNTINTVASLIPKDPRLAEETLERLASLFRYSLQGSGTASVPLARELEVVEDYLHIQATRFGRRFTWTLQVAEGLDDVRVPPLFLQPLVENAVLHGVSNRRSGGEVAITVGREDDEIVCTVRDNGPDGEPVPSKGAGTAIADLRQRLHIRYGERGELVTERVAGGGFVSRLLLPVEASAA